MKNYVCVCIEREREMGFVPVPKTDLERVGFLVRAGSEVLDPPLGKARDGLHPRIGHDPVVFLLLQSSSMAYTEKRQENTRTSTD